MEYAKLLRLIADGSDVKKKDIKVVMDKLFETMLAAFIDSDNIEFGPFGVLSFQYVPPSSSETGGEHYTGRFKFSVNKKVAQYIIENNIEMIKQEEKE